MTVNIDHLQQEAYRVRAAIDTLKHFEMLNDHLARFPRGCCGITTEVFGQWLIDKGYLDCWTVEVKGRLGSHGWLLVEDVCLDLTGDQFAGENRPAVYVNKFDSWLDGLGDTRKHAPGFKNEPERYLHAELQEKLGHFFEGMYEPLHIEWYDERLELLQRFSGYTSEPEYLVGLRSTASEWRARYPEYEAGVVLIWNGSAYGWKSKLREAYTEKPGALAVDDAGHVYVAEGGDDYDGAKVWSLYHA